MTLDVATAISARLEARFAEELGTVEEARLVRRCADVAELLAVAEAGSVDVAAVSADFPGMDGSVTAELAVRGITVLAVSSPASLVDARAMEAWGVRHHHHIGSGTLIETLAAVRPVSMGSSHEPPAVGGPEEALRVRQEVSAAGVGQDAEPAHGTSAGNDRAASTTEGTVVTVWGPSGAPGRTTTAVHLAHLLAREGRTLLIDADTVAPSCAAVLGVLDEAPGVLAAARLVDAGTFTGGQLRRLAGRVAEGFDVLTGIGAAVRWAELSRHHLESIISVARQHYRWIVIDVAASLEADEALMYDTVAPTRHAAAIVAVEACAELVAVTAADPVSLQRFAASWPQARDLAGSSRVVVTKARRGAVGGDPDKVVARALRRFVEVEPVCLVPYSRDVLDTALLDARLVTQAAPESGFSRAMHTLAGDLGVVVETRARRRARVLRPRRLSRAGGRGLAVAGE